MNEQQALQILVQAAQLAHLPAQAHMQCQQAADILAKAVTPKEVKEAVNG